jgi:hypothetical protein
MLTIKITFGKIRNVPMKEYGYAYPSSAHAKTLGLETSGTFFATTKKGAKTIELIAASSLEDARKICDALHGDYPIWWKHAPSA